MSRGRLRVILDTNLLISYLLDPARASPSQRVVEAAVTGEVVPLLTPELVDELVAKIATKPYLADRIPPARAEALLGLLSQAGEALNRITDPFPSIVRDRKDDYLIAYARARAADILVTGDKDLLALDPAITAPCASSAPSTSRGSWPTDPAGVSARSHGQMVTALTTDEAAPGAVLVTTLGPRRRDDLGLILPHEHVFVDLRTWDQPGYGQADPADVVALMTPQIRAAQAQGVTAIVEPSGVGVGRRADLLLAVSQATGMPLVAPTGVYREPWVPPWVHAADEVALRDWMIAELTGEIEDTGVQAGWVKVSAGDDGMTDAERKILRAAAGASAATGAAVGSHTRRGRVVRDQLDLFEAAGGDPRRFVWIHTQLEPDRALRVEAGRRGAWLEFDGIGDPAEDDRYLGLVRHALDAGLADRLLLSQDRGWYDPAKPGGGAPLPYTHLVDGFLPALATAGVDDATIRRLTHANPFIAFAR